MPSERRAPILHLFAASGNEEDLIGIIRCRADCEDCVMTDACAGQLLQTEYLHKIHLRLIESKYPVRTVPSNSVSRHLTGEESPAVEREVWRNLLF